MGNIGAGLRYKILQRDQFKCQYCGRGVGDGIHLHIDHIVPRCEGGKNEESNLRTACADCNHGKGPHPGRKKTGKDSSKERIKILSAICEFCHCRQATFLSCDGNWDRHDVKATPEWWLICAECDLPGTNYEYYVPLKDLTTKGGIEGWRKHLNNKRWFEPFYFDRKIRLIIQR